MYHARLALESKFCHLLCSLAMLYYALCSVASGSETVIISSQKLQCVYFLLGCHTHSLSSCLNSSLIFLDCGYIEVIQVSLVTLHGWLSWADVPLSCQLSWTHLAPLALDPVCFLVHGMLVEPYMFSHSVSFHSSKFSVCCVFFHSIHETSANYCRWLKTLFHFIFLVVWGLWEEIRPQWVNTQFVILLELKHICRWVQKNTHEITDHMFSLLSRQN